MQLRIGNGYDIHRLVGGRPLILGGQQLHHPDGLGLDGHSDADVLVHAIMDALLGALSLGDIGKYFPPDDPQWKGADSLVLLEQVVALVRERGWSVVNVDSVVVAERPKLKPHIEAMRAAIANPGLRVRPKSAIPGRVYYESDGRTVHAYANPDAKTRYRLFDWEHFSVGYTGGLERLLGEWEVIPKEESEPHVLEEV
jgi:2-C-methyl-D-erythritol 2,4-cyclodiphosphate synthase